MDTHYTTAHYTSNLTGINCNIIISLLYKKNILAIMQYTSMEVIDNKIISNNI